MDIQQASSLINISKLKPKQEKIIKKLTQKKKNIMAILPTGFGKSATYIISHLILGKNSVVISPLISLMEDQTNKLASFNIDYICFNSFSNQQVNNKKINLMINNKKKYIMFFSPESFIVRGDLIKKLIIKDDLSFFTIDESHCLSSWKSFRNSYKDLNVIQKWTNNKKIPILCLTATATNNTIQEMMENLNIKKALLIKSSFYKPNLEISVLCKNNMDTDINKINLFIKENKNKTIIYCKTRKDTEKISYKLKCKQFKVDYYHANLSSQKRKSIQEYFTSDKLDIIVATVAFGMGIDIPNVNLIIHYGISKDVEAYYQEIGRGGRNGTQVKCILFWNTKDFCLNNIFNNNFNNVPYSNPSENKINIEIQKEKCILDYKSKKIKEYVYSNDCRQQFICKYFGEDIDPCNMCDNCLYLKKINTIPIYSTFLILFLMYKLEKRQSKYKLIDILIGNDNHYNKIIGFKSFKYIQKQSLGLEINNLIKNELIRELNIRTSNNKTLIVLGLTENGKEWLKKNYIKIEKSSRIIANFINSKYNNLVFHNILKYFK